MTKPTFDPEPEGRLNQLNPKGAHLKADLTRVFNANGIDTEMGMPDFVIANLTINLLSSVAMSNASARAWKSS